MASEEIDPWPHKYWSSVESLKMYGQFNSIHREKMEQILLAYGLPKETVAAIMILYRNTKVKVGSPDGDTEYFNIVAGVLQRDMLAPYLFIICLDNVLRTLIDKIREKRLEKKLDGNYTRMLQAILNKSWKQHHTRHQLYGHLPPIMKTIQTRQSRYAGHCWRSKDELISDVLLWTPTYGQAKAGWPAQTYIQQLWGGVWFGLVWILCLITYQPS